MSKARKNLRDSLRSVLKKRHKVFHLDVSGMSDHEVHQMIMSYKKTAKPISVGTTNWQILRNEIL